MAKRRKRTGETTDPMRGRGRPKAWRVVERKATNRLISVLDRINRKAATGRADPRITHRKTQEALQVYRKSLGYAHTLALRDPIVQEQIAAIRRTERAREELALRREFERTAGSR